MRLPNLISLYGLIASALASNHPALAQAKPENQTRVVAVYTYADIADLVLASELVILTKTKAAVKLKKGLASGVAPNRERQLVTAEVLSLLRGREGIEPRISYLIDLQRDANGKVEKLSGKNHIVFGVPGKNGSIRLVGPDSQIPDSPEAQTMVRRIIADSLKPEMPPRIIGISSAFFTPGELQGEGESQLFLDVEGDRPVSITIRHLQDSQPVWRVAVGETVDDNAGPPRKNSLLWYRLACALPPTLPADFLTESNDENRTAIIRDYALVIEGLGPCNRKRIKPGV